VSSAVTPEPASGSLVFTLLADATGCREGDAGTYQVIAAEDGLRVDLRATTDPCVARAAALQRGWVRTLRLENTGGRGALDGFAQTILLSIPAGSWSGGVIEGHWQLGTDDPAASILITADPQGVTEPCLQDGGAFVPIAPGIAAFEAYLDGLPGVIVQGESLTIGGLPARHVFATSIKAPSCSAFASMVAWRSQTGHVLIGSFDETSVDDFFLVEVEGTTFLMAIDSTVAETVVPSIEFTSGLLTQAPP
jgi:hypothetical protein